MIQFNIVFDNHFFDTDIINVPEEIADNMDEILREFFRWRPPDDDPDYWTVINGSRVSVLETDNFLKWLNRNYCEQYEKAYIVKQHVLIRPNMRRLEF